LCKQRRQGAHEKRPAVHRRPHPALLIDMEGESVGCELARRWQFDGIPPPKANVGERTAGESLQGALVGRPGTLHTLPVTTGEAVRSWTDYRECQCGHRVPAAVTEVSIPRIGDGGIQRLYSRMLQPEPEPKA
jgi:hypothetical protein